MFRDPGVCPEEPGFLAGASRGWATGYREQGPVPNPRPAKQLSSNLFCVFSFSESVGV